MSAQDEREARRVAEHARDKTWRGKSFLREVFLGRYQLDLLPAPPHGSIEQERPEFRLFYAKLKQFLHDEVDSVAIDESGEYPRHVLEGLAGLGAFGMTIDKQYGGLGFTHAEYVRVMTLLGSADANITALLSAHQAIGVPHPVQLFGTEALKQKYLPRCARGAISAFALTEPAVGSDPGRIATEARKSADGTCFVLDGKKLWCTNGTLAKVIVVLARDPDTQRVHALVVEMDWPGVWVERRCHFMGLRALGNAVISFDHVQVPIENLIGEEGDGLRIALATLNTGRLTLPAATAGAAKLALEISRKWCMAREQWGKPIGRHEAIAHGLAQMASNAYAMEAVAGIVGALADMPDRDIRIEAAAAKEWNTVRGWELTDLALQIRGGRGYETERSLASRGEAPIGIERMLRDSRINRIFEGSSEIMHLFIAREAVDKHLEVAGPLIDPELGVAEKLRALPRVLAFYARWYPAQWFGSWGVWFRYQEHGALGRHLRFAHSASHRLARSIFHGMLRYGPGLEHKQLFLFRAVDVALSLFAMTAALVRAHAQREHEPRGVMLAESMACATRRHIEDTLRAMWSNDDAEEGAVAWHLLAQHYAWLERGTIGVPFTIDELRPETMLRFFARRTPRTKAPAPTAPDERAAE